MKEYLAGVDIGGTKVAVILADPEGILIKVSQPTVLEGKNSAIPSQVDDLIEYACNEIKIEKDHISSLGISTASPFEKKGKFNVVVAPNMCGGLTDKQGLPNDWTFIPLQEKLTKIYERLALNNLLRIGNDASLSAVAERRFGAGKKKEGEYEDNMVYCTISTGIGFGVIALGRDLISGEIRPFHLLGMNGNAAHDGHGSMNDEGPKCNCGNIADLESLASGTGIAAQYNAATGKALDAKQVFEAYKKGDLDAKKVVKYTGYILGRGLADVAKSYSPHLIVLGGSVMKDADDLLPLITDEFYKHNPTPLTKDVKIMLSGLGNYVADMGALSIIMPEDWVPKWQKDEPWKHIPRGMQIDLDYSGKEIKRV